MLPSAAKKEVEPRGGHRGHLIAGCNESGRAARGETLSSNAHKRELTSARQVCLGVVSSPCARRYIALWQRLVRVKKIMPIVASVGAVDPRCMELCDVFAHGELSVLTSYYKADALEDLLRGTVLL